MRYDMETGQFVSYLSGISAEGVSFSSDGKWVAYVTYPEETLWRMRTDGSERLQLTFFSPAGLSTILVAGREKDRVHEYGAWQVLAGLRCAG